MEGYEGADFTTAQALFFPGKSRHDPHGHWLASEMKDVIPEDYQLGVFDFPTYADGALAIRKRCSAPPRSGRLPTPKVPAATKSMFHWPWNTSNVGPIAHVKPRGAKSCRSFPTITDVRCHPLPLSPVSMLQSLSRKPSETIIYYYGIHWDTALWAAWYQPVQALFLNQIGPEEMIETIDCQSRSVPQNFRQPVPRSPISGKKERAATIRSLPCTHLSGIITCFNKSGGALIIPFIAPQLILYVLVLLVTRLSDHLLRFHRLAGLTAIPIEFVGLKNYRILVKDSNFHNAIGNSLQLTLIGGFLLFVPALAIAWALQQKLARNASFHLSFSLRS